MKGELILLTYPLFQAQIQGIGGFIADLITYIGPDSRNKMIYSQAPASTPMLVRSNMSRPDSNAPPTTADRRQPSPSFPESCPSRSKAHRLVGYSTSTSRHEKNALCSPTSRDKASTQPAWQKHLAAFPRITSGSTCNRDACPLAYNRSFFAGYL